MTITPANIAATSAGFDAPFDGDFSGGSGGDFGGDFGGDSGGSGAGRTRQGSSAEVLSAYAPQDRRLASAAGINLPARAWGVVLFADISGFTPLTDALAQTLGRRRGAEALIRLLNQVYPPLIAAVEAWGGSVIGFSGDAITCWFASLAEENRQELPAQRNTLARHALTAAADMQRVMAGFANVAVSPSLTARLAIRVTVTSGAVLRCLVGDPALYVLDTIAGAAVNRVGVGDALARNGEIVMDEATWQALEMPPVAEWRSADDARFAVWAQDAPPVAQPARTQLPALADTTAQAWVLPSLLEAMRAGQERFIAELRPAAALFVRFTGIRHDATHAPQSTAGAHLDAYMRWAQAVVQQHEGAIIQLTLGDKGAYFYAAFGAPIALDNAIEHALLAALDLTEQATAMGFVEQTQAGVSYGLMRAGAYGGPTRRTYGVQGEEVNTAARLMAQAGAGEVLVTQQIADAFQAAGGVTEPRVQFAARGVVHLKGKVGSTRLFRVQRAQAQPASRQTLHHDDTPLVGRASELAHIAATLAAVQDAGALLVVEGAAGIGKSHLLADAVRAARHAGWEIIAAASHSSTRNTAFAAARQMTAGLLQLPAHVEWDTATVATALRALLPDAGERLPLLNDLMGIASAETAFTASLDARLRQEALIALLLELVQARARTARLLFVQEDAHWLDEASARFFGALLASIAYAPVAALVTARPRQLPEAIHAPAPHMHTLLLGDLDGRAVGDLVAHRLGAPVAPLVAALIQAQSQGNPFFAEELADALVEAGSIVKVDGAWTLALATRRALRAAHCLEGEEHEEVLRANAPLTDAELGVPHSVHGIVLARLDRLPDAARLTLKVASVVGRSFSLPLLRHVRQLAGIAETLEQNMAQALARDFVRLEIVQEDAGAQERFFFKHNITRDVAYSTLLDEQQRDLHEQVAAALEQVQPNAVEELAYHYYRSDTAQPPLRRRALNYLEAAARRAREDFANETALTFYARAQELDASPAISAGKCEVLHILGRRADELTLLQQISAHPERAAWDEARLWGDYCEAVGDYAQAQQWQRRALGVAQHAGDLARQSRCLVRSGTIAWRQGDYDTAATDFHAALALLQDTELRAERADAHYGLGLLHRQLGGYAVAQEHFERDLALRAAAPNPEREARTLNALGNMRSLQRHFASALPLYEQALAIRRKTGDRSGIGASLFSVAQCHVSLGEYARAAPTLLEALRIQRAVRNRWQEWLILNELGVLYWSVGMLAQARAHLEEGLTVSRAIHSEVGEAYLLCNLGLVLRDAGDPAAALAALDQGMTMAQAQEDATLIAICHLDGALASHMLGDNALALEKLAAAEESYTRLEQDAAQTAVLALRAHVHLARAETDAALAAAHRCLALLERCGDEVPDFPQRDYHYCALTLARAGESARAATLLAKAKEILHTRAARIGDAEMRAAFLENVPHNRALMQA